MEDDKELSCTGLPEVLLSVRMSFSECVALHFTQGLQNHCHSVHPFLPVISETSIFWSRIVLCWLSAQMLSSKGEIWAKNKLLSEHEKKKEKKPLFQWEQTYWKLHKNNPSTTAAELCSLRGGLGKRHGLLPKETGVELPSWSRVALHAWPRSEPRSLNCWVKWHRCLCLRLQCIEGVFSNSSLLL